MKVSGKLILKCDNCQMTNTIDSDYLNFECVESCERQMGAENNYYSDYQSECTDCKQKIEIEINVWEYPTGCFSDDEYRIIGATLQKKIDAALKFPE